MSLFLRNISFHGILLDALFTEDSHDWQTVADLVRQGMESGEVRPLHATIYDQEDVEEAFRYMAQGKHTGKVLIKVGCDILSLCFTSTETIRFIRDGGLYSYWKQGVAEV